MSRPLPPLVETAIRGKFLRWAVVIVVGLLIVGYFVVAKLAPPSAPPP